MSVEALGHRGGLRGWGCILEGGLIYPVWGFCICWGWGGGGVVYEKGGGTKKGIYVQFNWRKLAKGFATLLPRLGP